MGLTHQLVTQFTSFIAVEKELSEPVTGDLRTEQVQPMLPEGMTDEAVGLSTSNRAVTPNVAQSAPVESRPYQPTPSAPTSSGDGGGGAVEWLFLASLGALGGGRLLGKRRRKGGSTE